MVGTRRVISKSGPKLLCFEGRYKLKLRTVPKHIIDYFQKFSKNRILRIFKINLQYKKLQTFLSNFCLKKILVQGHPEPMKMSQKEAFLDT